jgi:hypothetical protein
MKKPSRRRVLFILAIGLILVLAEYFIIISVGLMNERILAAAVRLANGRLTGKMTITRLEGNPLRRFHVHYLRVFEADGALAGELRDADFFISYTGWFRPRITIAAEGAYFHAYKIDGVWNVKALRRILKPRQKPMNLPGAEIDVTVRDSRLVLSWNPAHVIDARIDRADAVLTTGGAAIHYSLTDLQARPAAPTLPITGFQAQGDLISTDRTWEYTLDSGHMVSSTSDLVISAGHYRPETAQVEAVFPAATVAPDFLAMFWPQTPLAVPLQGDASVNGTIDDLPFTATIDSIAGVVAARGTIKNHGSRIEATGTMFEFSAGVLLARPYTLTGLTGRFDVVYDRPLPSPTPQQAPGRAAKPAVARYLKGKVQADAFAYPGFNSFPFESEIEMVNDDFAGSLSSTAPGIDLTINASGNLADPRPLSVQAVFRDFNPRALKSSLIDGKIVGSLKLDGRGHQYKVFAGRGELTLASSRIGTTTIDSAEVQGSVAAGRISFESARATVNRANLTGTGWIELLNKQYPFSLDLTAELPDAAAVASLLGDKLTADQLTVKARIQGDRARWTAAGTGAAIAPRTAYLNAASLDFTADLSGSGTDRIAGKVAFHAKRMDAPKARSKDFSIPVFDLDARVTIDPSPLKTPRLDFEINSLPGPPDFSLATAGRLDLGAGARNFILDLNRADFRVIGRDYTLDKPSRIASRSGSVVVTDLKLRHATESIALDGAAYGARLDCTFTFDQFDLQPWTTKLAPGSTLSGLLGGTARITGPGAAPEIVAELRIQGPVMGGNRLDSIQGRLHVVPGRLELDVSGAVAGMEALRVTGQMPFDLGITPWRARLRQDEAMAVKVEADHMSLEALERLLPWAHEPRGRLSLNIDIVGTPRSPEWSGSADLKEVSFSVLRWGLEVTRMNAQAVIVKNVMTLPVFTVRAGDGKANASGSVTFHKFSLGELDLAVTAKRFPAMNTPEVSAVIDAELAIKGTYEAPLISGDIEFRDLVYRPPLLLQYQSSSWETEDKTIVMAGATPPEPVRLALFDRTGLKLAVKIPETGQLRNTEMNVRFEGELGVRKPPSGSYRVSGELKSKQGWIVFQGKAFQVETARFFFPAIPIIDPDLEILASYKVPDYKTYIKIGGRLYAPTLEIYSEPALDPADVLAVILFGKPAGKLSEGQQNALVNAGANILGGIAAAGLAESLRDTLHLDTIILQPGPTPESGSVGVGGYLTDRIYVFYQHHFGPDAAEEFRLRYEIWKNFSFEAGQDEKGQSGLDLFFTHLFGKPKDQEKKDDRAKEEKKKERPKEGPKP